MGGPGQNYNTFIYPHDEFPVRPPRGTRRHNMTGIISRWPYGRRGICTALDCRDYWKRFYPPKGQI